MSEFIAMRPIRAIEKHPNADKLAILKVGTFQVVHSLEAAEKLKIGQLVGHVPTDICLAPEKAVELGVDKYCRNVQVDGKKAPCRVIAARLRGAPSYGFIIIDPPVSDDQLDEYYGVWKYEPPAISIAVGGEKEREEHPQFPKYTKIKRIQLGPDAWDEGLPVRVTEKLHGMTCRFGVVQVGGEWRFMVGSHNVILRQPPEDSKKQSFWDLLDAPVMTLLNRLCDGERPVVVYGERVGLGVQDMDYGYEDPQFHVFDIRVDGQFLDWDLVRTHCEYAKVRTVPLLDDGPFSWCMVDSLTDGGSVVQNPGTYKTHFKGREGIVITPLQETYSDVLGGRLIAKSVSVDYETRKGKKTEYH